MNGLQKKTHRKFKKENDKNYTHTNRPTDTYIHFHMEHSCSIVKAPGIFQNRE